MTNKLLIKAITDKRLELRWLRKLELTDKKKLRECFKQLLTLYAAYNNNDGYEPLDYIPTHKEGA